MGTARLGIRFATEDVRRDFHPFANFEHYPAIAHSARAVAVHPAPSPDLSRDSERHPLTGGCGLRFEAGFDLGLSGVMDPIAEHTLRQITRSVLAGLFGDITILGASVNATGVSTP